MMLDTKSSQKLPLTKKRKQIVKGYFFLWISHRFGGVFLFLTVDEQSVLFYNYTIIRCMRLEEKELW